MKIEERIEEVLQKIRPFLKSDGGDVKFIKYEDGIVYVKLLGACSHCHHANFTLETTITSALTLEIPEIIKVVNIQE